MDTKIIDGDSREDNSPATKNGLMKKIQHKPRAPRQSPSVAHVMRDLEYLVKTNPNAAHLQADCEEIAEYIHDNFTTPSFNKNQLLNRAEEVLRRCETVGYVEKIGMLNDVIRDLDRAIELEPTDVKVWTNLLSAIDDNLDLLGSRKKTSRISLLNKFLMKYKPSEKKDIKFIFKEAYNLCEFHIQDGNYQGAADTLHQVLCTIDKEFEGYENMLDKWLKIQVENKELIHKPLNQSINPEKLSIETLTKFIIYKLPEIDENELNKLLDIYYTQYRPNNVTTCIYLIQELRIYGKNDLAYNLFSLCKLENATDNPGAIKFQADMHLQLGRNHEACDLYLKLLKINPNNEDINIKLITYSKNKTLVQSLLEKQISSEILINNYFSITDMKTKVLVCDKILSNLGKCKCENLQNVVLDTICIHFQFANIDKIHEISLQTLKCKQLVEHRLQNSYLAFLSSLHLKSDIWKRFLDFTIHSKCNSTFSLRIYNIVKKLLDKPDLKKLERWEFNRYTYENKENSIFNDFMNAKIIFKVKTIEIDERCNRAINMLKPHINLHYNESFMIGATMCLLGFSKKHVFYPETTQVKTDRVRGWMYTYNIICNVPYWYMYNFAEEVHQNIMNSEEAKINAYPLHTQLTEISALVKLNNFKEAEKMIQQIINKF